jgi:plasmid stabilization system protein ParE
MTMLRLGLSTSALWWEACQVIGMRCVVMSLGGEAAAHEYNRLIPEKIAALVDAQIAYSADVLLGRTTSAPQSAVSLYRRRVRSNRRRLLRAQ